METGHQGNPGEHRLAGQHHRDASVNPVNAGGDPTSHPRGVPSPHHGVVHSSLPPGVHSSLPPEVHSSLPHGVHSSLPYRVHSSLPPGVHASLPLGAHSFLPPGVPSPLPLEVPPSPPPAGSHREDRNPSSDVLSVLPNKRSRSDPSCQQVESGAGSRGLQEGRRLGGRDSHEARDLGGRENGVAERKGEKSKREESQNGGRGGLVSGQEGPVVQEGQVVQQGPVVRQGQVVLRREQDPDARLRRGSLKSRFFQFKKRKKDAGKNEVKKSEGRGWMDPVAPRARDETNQPAIRNRNGVDQAAPADRNGVDKDAHRAAPRARDSTDRAALRHPLPMNKPPSPHTLRESPLIIEHLEREPYKRKREPAVILIDPPSPPKPSPTIPIYAQPTKKSNFRINSENDGEQTPVPPARKVFPPREQPARTVEITSVHEPVHQDPVLARDRPAGLLIPAVSRPHRQSVNIDTSFTSSCSLPSSPLCRDVEVVLRTRGSPTATTSSGAETGRLLKSALTRHFRNMHCGASQSGSSETYNAGAVLSIGLDHYIREIFKQLDYNHTGLVSREDFLTLCEVLELNSSPPVSKRNSGIEWLSSYRPRPNSPGSPLRLDRLSQVKYVHQGRKPPQKEPPSFLWTIGPRPFWELWPQKKRRKKQLNLDDFAKCLLEQWAKTYGYPTHLVGDNVFNSLRDQIGFFETSESPDVATASLAFPLSTGAEASLSSEETRSRRLIRSIVRVSRRYHVLERLARRIQSEGEDERTQLNGSSEGHRSNGTGLVNPGRTGNGSGPGYGAGLSNGSGLGNGAGGMNGGGRLQGGVERVPPTYHENLLRDPPSNKSRRFSSSKVRLLENQSLQQKHQLNSLREVIEDLRSSLQLSDAQNLALQVSLKKVEKAEGRRGRRELRNSMEESEKQLENLVKELKEMSETQYPTMSSQLSSTCAHGLEEELEFVSTSLKEELEVVSTSLENTVSTLYTTRQGLSSAQMELRHTAQRLQPRPQAQDDAGGGAGGRAGGAGGAGGANLIYSEVKRVRRKETGGEGGRLRREEGPEEERGRGGRGGSEDKESMREAYSALQRAQREISQLRISLEIAQSALEQSRLDLESSLQEYSRVQQSLKSSEAQLAQAESRAIQLNQNRRSLLLELQSTKEVLVSSLNKVHDLEVESQKVPFLQHRIQELERRLLARRYDPKGVRPLSTIDSGLYSTDSTDSEQDHEKRIEVCSDEDQCILRDQGLPPRPPSARSRDKSPRSNTPSSAASEKSPRSNTPSSGHHSAGSKLSSSSIQSQVRSPEGGESVLPRLRREIEALKKKFHQAEKDWGQERSYLMEELSKRRDDFGEISTDLQVLEAERFRLSLLEDKIKEVLRMLRTLNNMNISQKALGRLVLEAVEQSVDPLVGEIQVFKFLNCLYQSTRDYERIAADQMLARALEAVEGSEEDDSDSSDSLSNIPEGMGTMRPRRVRVEAPNPTFTIDV